MDKRSSLLLIALGVLTAAPYIFSIAGLAYQFMLVHRLLAVGGMISAIVLVVWGVYGLSRNRS
ncbi:MAG: hypothetical protein K2P70_13635 [Hyphomonadaceae bacterium]|nr:hypothetical protein [Hyphomonadaceae bacterium]